MNKKLDKFFARMDELGLALAYEDVRLKTQYSDILPAQADVNSQFSKHVPLKMPIVSAAMDNVTQTRMAIAIAKLGGLGIVHRGLAPKDQADHVDAVKHHLNALIRKPVYFFEDQSVKEILARKKEKGYEFDSFPILSRSSEKLVGVITGNDLDFIEKPGVSIKDVMSTDLVTASEKCDIKTAYKKMRENKKKLLPLVDKDLKLKGLYIYSDVKRIVTREQGMFNIDSLGQLRVGAAIGVWESDAEEERIERLIDKHADVLVIDTAHGHNKAVISTIFKIKAKYKVDVVAGNVSEPESVDDLIEAGVDGIKVGQGPGSICTTRIVAGIGCPQVTAVYNCAKAAKGRVPVCADGGISYSGDISVAIAVGASSVMAGNLLSGTEETPGEVILWEGRQWKNYRGMGSLEALAASASSRDRYKEQGTKAEYMVPEGIEGLVPYKGSIEPLLIQYIGGLKKGMGYVGAKNIAELQDKADLWRISQSGKEESHPHEIVITKDAPNYPGKRRS
ncbi:IMP dehydrogenase [Elusimicrobiota bacterium]